MKKITFVTGKQRKFEVKDVKVDKLNGTARKLAELIYTTENADDLSNVFVRSPKINLDFMKEMLKSDEEIENIKRVFGEEILEERPVMTWTWDKLRENETPEQYFERHARNLDNIGGEIIGSRGEEYINNNNLRTGTTWVTTYSDAETDEVGKAREKLMKIDKATFFVCTLDFNNEYFLIGDSTEFIIAKELGIPITLVEYDENDFININDTGFEPDQFAKFVNEEGYIRVGDFFDAYTWNGETYKIEAELIKGKPEFSFTDKEQEMKICTPTESGVAIHQAYIDLGMTEESDLNMYMQYYINKMENNK